MKLSSAEIRPLIMGVVNVTPDSFSGDGTMAQVDYAASSVARATQMIGEGADMLDIGGESSRPGAQPVDTEEEIRRVAPVIAAIRKKHGELPLAIDTVKAKVAAAALDAGATIVNDVSALGEGPCMAKLVAQRGVSIVLMHNRGKSGEIAQDEHIGGEFAAPVYGDVIEDVARDLGESIRRALDAGIAKEQIIADPGIGFGKTVAQNCALINHLDLLKEKLGYPVLIGPSRKSFIGRVLDLPVEERLEGTAAAVAVAALRGADILRVHDVKFMARLVRMIAAINVV